MVTNECFDCAWYLPGEDEATCFAYAPGPIPTEIITGEVSHVKERGDEVRKGIVFKSTVVPPAKEKK